MTDPTAGTVLGEEARRAIALKLWGMERAGDSDPEGQAWQRTDAALAVAEPFIAAALSGLLSAAREAGREEGRREERVRCAGQLRGLSAYTDRPDVLYSRLDALAADWSRSPADA